MEMKFNPEDLKLLAKYIAIELKTSYPVDAKVKKTKQEVSKEFNEVMTSIISNLTQVLEPELAKLDMKYISNMTQLFNTNDVDMTSKVTEGHFNQLHRINRSLIRQVKESKK